MTWESFKNHVVALFEVSKDKTNFQILDDVISYEVKNTKYVFKKDDFEKISKKLVSIDDSLVIYTNNTLQVLFDSPKSSRISPLYHNRKLLGTKFDDKENNIKYQFGRASDEMTLLFVDRVFALNKNDFRTRPYLEFYGFSEDEPFPEETLVKTDFSLLNIVNESFSTPSAITLISKGDVDKDKLLDYASSMLFTISYNLDTSFRMIRRIGDVLFRRSMARRRINLLQDIEPPRVTYNQELIDKYYMATSSEDPFVKFIGYYHVIEFFFEEVYDEELVKQVRGILNSPKFSSKNNKGISEIIEKIKKKTKINKEESQGFEQEALGYTLSKYVDIDELKKEIETIDKTSCAYYQSNEVSFSHGGIIDFTNRDKIYTKMAARIYKTRNSLVHGKSNDNTPSGKERSVYKPYSDNIFLLKEIPLLRAIAEIIIIKSAK